MQKLIHIVKGVLMMGLLVASFSLKAQQQGQYSQYMMNYYLINPAASGTDDFIHLRTGYRNQWTGFDGAPKNYYLSGYSTVDKLHSKRPRGKKIEPHFAVGGLFTGQKTGILMHNAFYLSYSYHLPVTKTGVLSFGAMLGASQFSIDRDAARTGDYQADLALYQKNQTKLDANIGIWFYSPKIFGGISSISVTQSRIDFASGAPQNGALNRHFYATVGYNFQLDRYWSVIPSVLYKNTTAANQIDLNAKLRFRDLFWGGASYRRQDAVAIMLGLGIPLDKTRPNQRHGHKKFIDIGYCYDITTSKLNRYSYGSHEIMIALRLPTAGKRIASPSDYW